ncbi:MAG: hypothetical protein JOZ22_22635, partial [Acidobacteriia bacterium]|nr:hypothetical protein [Terriglobia bacterium]
RWETSHLAAGTHKVKAIYEPAAGSEFLASSSREKLQIVKRCACVK